MKLPSVPTAEQQQKMQAVQDKAGTFGDDAAWVAVQEASHTKTLALIDKQIKTGGDEASPALRRRHAPPC